MRRFLIGVIIFSLVSTCLLMPTQEAQAQAPEVTVLGGPGSRVSMKSDTNLLFSSGGGHIEWTISGPVAIQLRQLMDTNPRDGNVSFFEASNYVSGLDLWIEGHYIQYHGAKILRCSLMNHQVTTDTSGLITGVDSLHSIGINFIYDAAPVDDDTNYPMNDAIFVHAIFASMNRANMTFEYNGEVELRHINTFVGLESIILPQSTNGRVTHYILPLVDYYDYSASYSGSEFIKTEKEDWNEYFVFDPMSNTIVVLVVLIILWVIIVNIPKWFANYYNKKGVFGLRGGFFGLIALEIIFYVLAWRYMVLYVIAALFLVISCLLSYFIYGRSKLAKDLEPKDKPDVRSAEPTAAPSAAPTTGAPAAGAPAPSVPAPVAPAAPSTKEPMPVIEDLFLIYKDGRLISHNTRKLKPEMDDDVMSGMFTAVQEFIKTSFGGDDETPVDEISYGKNKILIEHGKYIFISAVIEGRGSDEMHERMKIAVQNIELLLEPQLKDWSGDTKDLKDARIWLKTLISGDPIERLK